MRMRDRFRSGSDRILSGLGLFGLNFSGLIKVLTKCRTLKMKVLKNRLMIKTRVHFTSRSIEINSSNQIKEGDTALCSHGFPWKSPDIYMGFESQY